jgi:hypothetical protein
MTPRERLQAALGHRHPDRVPVDFGATAVTGMHVTVVAALRRHFGLEPRPVKVCEPFQMLGAIEPDLAAAMALDVEGIGAPDTLFGFPNENWREFTAPWGQALLVSEHFRTTVDANGDLLLYPGGDLEAPPSGRLPVGGFFFDTIIRQPPLVEAELDPEDNLEEFGPVSDRALRHIAAETARIRRSPLGRVGSFGGTGLGDIALVPAPFLRRPRGIRDVAEWYVSTLTRQPYVHRVFAAQTETALENLARIHAVVGDAIDVLFVCGTDFGTQQSTFCSPETFDSLYAPYYTRINAWVHAHTSWKTFKHSCGAVAPFLRRFIDCGFDVFNPVQCSAAGMDPTWLKREYGADLVFWGGGVDTQHTLPFGTPAEVRKQVLRRCEIFARDGGFVFNAIHNVQANTPIENVAAMLAAVRQFDGRG